MDKAKDKNILSNKSYLRSNVFGNLLEQVIFLVMIAYLKQKLERLK